jgi:hypothetical protein
LACALLVSCAGGSASVPAPVISGTSPTDTSGLVPPGLGTLRQEDVALRLQHLGVTLRAVPLNESVLRLLSPDSYRALRELRESRRDAVSAVARRAGQRAPSQWYVSFHNQEQGDARFTPSSLTVTNVGRDFRPLDVVPLTAGFGAQRLGQRETQSAIVVFDEALDVSQPLLMSYEGVVNNEWTDRLQRMERERALIRSRSR